MKRGLFEISAVIFLLLSYTPLAVADKYDAVRSASQHWILLIEACNFTYPTLSKPSVYRKMTLDLVNIGGFSHADAENISDAAFDAYDRSIKTMNPASLAELKKIDDGARGHFIYCENAAFEKQQAFRKQLRLALSN